jgi:hypothetical protein
MQAMRCAVIPLLALLAMVADASSVRAEKPAFPHSYSVTTKDDRFVFVMLVPPGMESDEGAREIELRKKYGQSGLYRNDGSTVPLWTVRGYSRKAYPASDGVHLVCVSQFYGGGSPAGQVVGFFAHGKPTGVYSADELTSAFILLPSSASGTIWLRDDDFDEANLKYSVSTYDGNSFTFDVRTGAVVSSRKPWRLVGVCLLAVLTAVAGLWFYLYTRRARRKAGS